MMNLFSALCESYQFEHCGDSVRWGIGSFVGGTFVSVTSLGADRYEIYVREWSINSFGDYDYNKTITVQCYGGRVWENLPAGLLYGDRR